MAVFERKKATKVTLDDTVPLSCTIETTQNVKDHTEYFVRVQRGPVAENSWTLTKRYSDFSTLDTNLKISGYDLPLPPKKVFGNMDREFIAERQHGLQVYLQEILSNQLLSSSIAVKRFLDPKRYSSDLGEQALQHVQMIFRSEPHWDVVEPLPDIGWRLRKQYFLIKPKTQPKARLVLSWCDYGPDRYIEEKDLFSILKLLPQFQHPNIYTITHASCNETGGLIIRQFHEKGTLRDFICKAKPKLQCMKKYGKQKMYTVCPVGDTRLYGRQILEALKFLHDKGFPYGHLHASNVIIEDNVCKLLDIENFLLGLPSSYRSYFTQFKKILTMEQIDVYCFGQLLYEMVYGKPVNSATCDHFPAETDANIRSVLESILTSEACKNGIPSVTDLLSHPLFVTVNLPHSEKPQVKIPSKLKELIKNAKSSTENRLHEEQKVIHQIRRLSKAQAYHMSDEEKKKRRRSRKKQAEQNGDGPEEAVLTPNTPVSPTSPTSPAPRDPPQPAINDIPPPPPPPPPQMQNGISTPTPVGGSGDNPRGALLSSISGFKKGGLKKAETVDKSSPLIR